MNTPLPPVEDDSGIEPYGLSGSQVLKAYKRLLKKQMEEKNKKVGSSNHATNLLVLKRTLWPTMALLMMVSLAVPKKLHPLTGNQVRYSLDIFINVPTTQLECSVHLSDTVSTQDACIKPSQLKAQESGHFFQPLYEMETFPSGGAIPSGNLLTQF